MRQRFVIYPDRMTLRSEPSARRKKIAVVFVLAATAIVGMPELYPQDDAAADWNHSDDRPNQTPSTLAQVLPHAAANPIPIVPPTNSSHALTIDSVWAANGSIPVEGGAVSLDEFQNPEHQSPENRQRVPSDQPPGKVPEKSPSPKQKVARHRSNEAGSGYAQYTYGAWPWYSQRTSPSPFFRF
jgi:hypothetical protein